MSNEESASRPRKFAFGRGWYQVAWSGEIGLGDVVPLRYFNEDLVLFRTESGTVSVLDAHCPHLGAHIGFGGKVKGECVVCPFHEWQWSTTGQHMATPFSERKTQRKRIRAWSTTETAGMICVWYDHEGGEPTWDAPQIAEADDPRFTSPWPLSANVWKDVILQPQHVTENMVDFVHLKSVHHAARPASVASAVANGPRFQVALRLGVGEGKKATKITPDGPIDTLLEATGEALGFTVFKFVDLSPTRYITAVTPVDEKTSDVRISLFLPKDRGLENGRLSAWGEASFNELKKQNQRDFDIFRHLKYTEHSPFTPEEQPPYSAMREWTKQFYEPLAAQGGAR